MELNTTEKLCDYIAATYPNQIDAITTPLAAAVWFCCIQEAQNLCQLDLKDLASVVQHGMPCYAGDEEAAVQQWLYGHEQYIKDSIEEDEEYTTLEALLEDHFTTPQ